MIVIMMTYNSYLEVLFVALPKTYLETFITLTEGFTVRAKSCAILKRDPTTSGGNIFLGSCVRPHIFVFR